MSQLNISYSNLFSTPFLITATICNVILGVNFRLVNPFLSDETL